MTSTKRGSTSLTKGQGTFWEDAPGPTYQGKPRTVGAHDTRATELLPGRQAQRVSGSSPTTAPTHQRPAWGAQSYLEEGEETAA